MATFVVAHGAWSSGFVWKKMRRNLLFWQAPRDPVQVSVFGPSDARRYFSGGTGAVGTPHVVVQPDLWCAPCNLIRKPPAECQEGEAPECLRLVTVDEVYAAARRVLAS